MNKSKEILVTAFALFSLFFGAGNLILPPQLGFKFGEYWWLVALGFCISAVLIPILGIVAHSKLQGTMFHFAHKVSPAFSLTYCFIVYAISLALPSPRTASVTHEMAIEPFFNIPAIATSIVYFLLVFIFVMNRSRILNIIGKFLTPAIIIILALIIGTSLFQFELDFAPSEIGNPFSHGVIEGYQTFDAIGAVVVGAVIIISINLKNKNATYEERRSLIAKAGWLAGLGLFLIYGGLIITGALMHNEFDASISRTGLLSGISRITLGNTGNLMLSLLVSLACFTTAVGIVAGTADFVKSRLGNNKLAYTITAVIGCFLGVLMGQFNVGYIIAIALPALMFIYPITIVLILLNALPGKFTTPKVFKWVIFATIIFSIPDFLGSIGLSEEIAGVQQWIPFSSYSLGWVIPSLLVLIITNLKRTAVVNPSQ
ncbi:branched-chain amino acid transport system II carrier protein [Muriicola sp. Z0-33]|uniref:branched-chain amino acid transport system II carrier protein n=1 Tax=Muriicola sp. Z0-33 TaxID=2816957 RepID=UPI002238FF20|nr:branched-chain amino acid transport system II carrier protein [Muriicola sp. Z0-33]MCW5516323.1 branched-chain amino acid transport system II carrier protein [Muriicola sp. Z0-33]